MKILSIIILSVGLAACGSKAKKTSTTPDKADQKSDAMGGAGYGGNAPMGSGAPATGGDPCAAK